jgi:hypothetical protein
MPIKMRIIIASPDKKFEDYLSNAIPEIESAIPITVQSAFCINPNILVLRGGKNQIIEEDEYVTISAVSTPDILPLLAKAMLEYSYCLLIQNIETSYNKKIYITGNHYKLVEKYKNKVRKINAFYGKPDIIPDFIKNYTPVIHIKNYFL